MSYNVKDIKKINLDLLLALALLISYTFYK